MARKESDFEVICVGTGPAGLFAALELTKRYPGISIGMFDKGSDRKIRTEDNLTSGLGGAGAFSDGKLTLPNPEYPQSLTVGGGLASMMGEKKFLELVEYVRKTYAEFGGKAEIYETNRERIQELVDEASTLALRLIPTRTYHLGSDLAPKIIQNIVKELKSRGVNIFLESEVRSIKRDGDGFSLQIVGKNAGQLRTNYIIAAPGREGAEWLASQAKALGLKILPRQLSVDVGVRVEVQAHIFAPLTNYLYDPKIEYYPKPFETRTRTFCVCPQGEVVIEKYRGLLTTVNGHALFEKSLSENTNFAILVSATFTEPFKEPLKYAGRISELANMLGEKVLLQRLGDLRQGRRSKPERIERGFVAPTLKEATPGDLSFAIPYRFLNSILGTLEALDKIAPGVNGDHTLLYGNEVKFYSNRIETTEELEAQENFFVAGDGAGITRGLVQSSASGVIVAKAIAKRTKKRKLAQ